MKVLVIGSKGYLGYALSLYLKRKGYKVLGIDNNLREKMVQEVGSYSAIPIENRYYLWEQREISTLDAELLNVLKEFQPDAIVHLGEQPSAPYSMKSMGHAAMTQINNVIGTLNLLWAMKEVCPDAALVKIGTMGEYGDWIYRTTPIPETNRIKIQYAGKTIEIPTPRFAGSFYHFSKIFDSFNIEFACKIWGIRATDLNQGIVYGTQIEGMDNYTRTRFDFDEYFGTVVNRFIAQAVSGIPLTIYGAGGQTRGFININNTMHCIELALNNPPEKGQFRVFNQLTEVFTINEIAELVRIAAKQFRIKVNVRHIDNPRIEKEKHPYYPIAQRFKDLGLKPILLKAVLPQMIADILPHKERILAKKELILPKTKWSR